MNSAELRWNKPHDKAVIQELRRRVDAHADEPYAEVPTFINWLWYSQMVTAMEKGLESA